MVVNEAGTHFFSKLGIYICWDSNEFDRDKRTILYLHIMTHHLFETFLSYLKPIKV